MKKLVLKLSVLVMILTLVTLPLVSGTYAKYATEVVASDTARVAKWGVTVSANVQNVFGEAYLAEADGNTSVDYLTANVTVNSGEDNTDVLAPGTEGSFTFGVTGTPEVSVALTYEATVTLEGWDVIGEGDNDYQPINFTLYDQTHYSTTEGAFTSDIAVVLTGAELQAAIIGLTHNYAPLTPLAKTYTVAWEWPFEKEGTYYLGTSVEDYYVSDGLGGYEAAEGVFVPGTTYYTDDTGEPEVVTTAFLPATSYDSADTILGNLGTPTLSISVTITATQID